MTNQFLFATGIENSCPTIDNGRVRMDELEKCTHYTKWRTDFELVSELGIQFLRYGPPILTTWLGDNRYDWSFNGVFAKELDRWSIDFEKAARPESARGFVPVAKRWVVERSIAWTNFFRRTVKDYEYTVSSSVSWLYLANSQIMLQRIEAANQT